MSTPLRVFCPGPSVPTVTELLAFAAARGRSLTPYEAYALDARDGADWDSTGFRWRPDGPPLFVELERPDGPDGRQVARAIAAARAHVRTLPPGPRRDEAQRRLAVVNYVAAIHVPVAGCDEAGWRAAEALAACFEAGPRGVTEVLGAGFSLGGEPLTPR